MSQSVSMTVPVELYNSLMQFQYNGIPNYNEYSENPNHEGIDITLPNLVRFLISTYGVYTESFMIENVFDILVETSTSSQKVVFRTDNQYIISMTPEKRLKALVAAVVNMGLEIFNVFDGLSLVK